MELLQWFINFVMKKKSGNGIKNDNMFNKELAEELPNQLLKHLIK